MENPVKKIAAINDLSGIGRSSLTAMISIVSYMGIQVCPVPTSVLSTQTSGYKDYTFVDLTESMEGTLNHWINEDIKFNCIFSGFLGSEKQADIIIDFINNKHNKDCLVIVDPVMGDNGELYDTVDHKITSKMKELVYHADIILPNVFEAYHLLDRNGEEEITEEQAKKLMKELSQKGPTKVVITGAKIKGENNKIVTFCYDKNEDKAYKIVRDYIPVYYPGTGDAFASVFAGSILSGNKLPVAVLKASKFVLDGIMESEKYDYPTREGILIEKVLNTLGENSGSENIVEI